MKTFQIVTLFALIAAAMAFAPSQVPQGEILSKGTGTINGVGFGVDLSQQPHF